MQTEQPTDADSTQSAAPEEKAPEMEVDWWTLGTLALASR